MKNLFRILTVILIAFWMISCGSREETVQTENIQTVQSQDPTEVIKVMSSEKGDTIRLSFFAKDDEIAIRLKKDGKERELLPKGVSEKGNPVFSDGEYGWEMFDDGSSGRLFTTGSQGSFYKEN